MEEPDAEEEESEEEQDEETESPEAARPKKRPRVSLAPAMDKAGKQPFHV